MTRFFFFLGSGGGGADIMLMDAGFADATFFLTRNLLLVNIANNITSNVHSSCLSLKLASRRRKQRKMSIIRRKKSPQLETHSRPMVKLNETKIPAYLVCSNSLSYHDRL